MDNCNSEYKITAATDVPREATDYNVPPDAITIGGLGSGIVPEPENNCAANTNLRNTQETFIMERSISDGGLKSTETDKCLSVYETTSDTILPKAGDCFTDHAPIGVSDTANTYVSASCALNVSVTGDCHITSAPAGDNGSESRIHKDYDHQTSQTSNLQLQYNRIQKEPITLDHYGFLYFARFSYEAWLCDTISFEKGDIFDIIDISNSEWWFGRSQKTRFEGYVPANYLAFYGYIDRPEVDKSILVFTRLLQLIHDSAKHYQNADFMVVANTIRDVEKRFFGIKEVDEMKNLLKGDNENELYIKEYHQALDVLNKFIINVGFYSSYQNLIYNKVPEIMNYLVCENLLLERINSEYLSIKVDYCGIQRKVFEYKFIDIPGIVEFLKALQDSGIFSEALLSMLKKLILECNTLNIEMDYEMKKIKNFIEQMCKSDTRYNEIIKTTGISFIGSDEFSVSEDVQVSPNIPEPGEGCAETHSLSNADDTCVLQTSNIDVINVSETSDKITTCEPSSDLSNSSLIDSFNVSEIGDWITACEPVSDIPNSLELETFLSAYELARLDFVKALDTSLRAQRVSKTFLEVQPERKFPKEHKSLNRSSHTCQSGTASIDDTNNLCVTARDTDKTPDGIGSFIEYVPLSETPIMKDLYTAYLPLLKMINFPYIKLDGIDLYNKVKVKNDLKKYQKKLLSFVLSFGRNKNIIKFITEYSKVDMDVYNQTRIILENFGCSIDHFNNKANFLYPKIPEITNSLMVNNLLPNGLSSEFATLEANRKMIAEFTFINMYGILEYMKGLEESGLISEILLTNVQRFAISIEKLSLAIFNQAMGMCYYYDKVNQINSLYKDLGENVLFELCEQKIQSDTDGSDTDRSEHNVPFCEKHGWRNSWLKSFKKRGVFVTEAVNGTKEHIWYTDKNSC